MKKLLFAVLLLCSVNAFAQTDSTKKIFYFVPIVRTSSDSNLKKRPLKKSVMYEVIMKSAPALAIWIQKAFPQSYYPDTTCCVGCYQPISPKK